MSKTHTIFNSHSWRRSNTFKRSLGIPMRNLTLEMLTWFTLRSRYFNCFIFSVGQYALRGQDSPQCLVLTVWLTCNVVLFVETFWTYSTVTEYHYLRYITGIGLSFSRASATIIMFNSFLLLLLICRNTISAIKGIKCLSFLWLQKCKNILDIQRMTASKEGERRPILP